MSLTITDVAGVRSAGSLNEPAGSPGAATDKQLQAAIKFAVRDMQQLVTAAVYNEVRDYSETDLADADKAKKQNDFRQAESAFAISHLPRLLNAQQLAATGIISEIKTGEVTKRFSTSEGSMWIRDKWVEEAYRWLSTYLPTNITNASTQEVEAVRSKRGGFYLSSI